jgi:hypothetical protein
MPGQWPGIYLSLITTYFKAFTHETEDLPIFLSGSSRTAIQTYRESVSISELVI